MVQASTTTGEAVIETRQAVESCVVLCRTQCRRICTRITKVSSRAVDRATVRLAAYFALPACVCTVARLASPRLVSSCCCLCAPSASRAGAAVAHFFFFCVEGFQKIARWLLALSLMLSAPWPPSICVRLSPRRQKIGGAAMTWPVV